MRPTSQQQTAAASSSSPSRSLPPPPSASQQRPTSRGRRRLDDLRAREAAEENGERASEDGGRHIRRRSPSFSADRKAQHSHTRANGERSRRRSRRRQNGSRDDSRLGGGSKRRRRRRGFEIRSQRHAEATVDRFVRFNFCVSRLLPFLGLFRRTKQAQALAAAQQPPTLGVAAPTKAASAVGERGFGVFGSCSVRRSARLVF